MLSFPFQYARVWRRAIACLVDTLLVLIVGALISPVFLEFLGFRAAHAASHAHPLAMTVAWTYVAWAVLVIGIGWLYYALQESSRRHGTIGKRLMGIIVLRRDESRLTFRDASRRYWSKILSASVVGLGFALALFDKKSRTLHDRVAKTLVLEPAWEKIDVTKTTTANTALPTA